MALDTEAKRRAVTGVARPWLRSNQPDAGTPQAWRTLVGNTYPVTVGDAYVLSSAGVFGFVTVSVGSVEFFDVASGLCWPGAHIQPWYESGGNGPPLELRTLLNPVTDASASALLNTPRVGEGIVRIMEGQHGKVFYKEPIVRIAVLNVNVNSSQTRNMAVEFKKVPSPGGFVLSTDSVVLPKENRYIGRRGRK